MTQYADGRSDDRSEFSGGYYKEASGWSVVAFLVAATLVCAAIGRVLGL